MKPTISVLGLLPSQAHIIEGAYKNRAKFRFVDGDGCKAQKIKAIANGSDAIFMRSKHANHNTFVALKSAHANFQMVNGGMNSLHIAIGEFLNDK